MFNAAAGYGEVVCVLNTDEWLVRKKQYYMMDWSQRAAIIGALKPVARVVKASDGDDTVCETLRWLKPDFFAKGFDRGPRNTPEADLCREMGIECLYNIGDPSFKDLHSSNLVKRAWGEYRLLAYKDESHRVKSLTVMPDRELSYQKHMFRSEHWYVVAGLGKLTLDARQLTLRSGDAVDIPKGCWHTVKNIGQQPLEIVEVQKGIVCDEADIVRKERAA